MFNNLIIFYLIFCFQINFIFNSSINCTFEKIKEEKDENFCGWKPENNIWKTGNEVLVDSVNYVIHPSSGGDRFAYVQGHYGSPLEGKLSSPLISSDKKLLRFNYWKLSNTPSMDICIEKEENKNKIEKCIDSIQGLGENQWILRMIELPREEKNFKIIFKARNLLSEDIIGIDDIQILPSEITEETNNKNQNKNKIKKQRKSEKENTENTNQNYLNQNKEKENTNENTNKNQNIKIKHKQRKSSNIKNSEEENTNQNNNNITRIIPYSEIIKNKKEEKLNKNNNTILKHVRLSPLTGRNNKIFFREENKNIDRLSIFLIFFWKN
ncbi:unnamed protein product [Meloidogyne enterolobii]|uniref:Uncharacterized protein n=1 Tax=Meloidogyne enterolobii TaxID=390850 RepID=A0ACB0ZB16_MELEN